ncbi:MAG: glycine--tRNA ligase, partial [Phycisphaeraceae bacterium]|nr:glycine--tRNA ligase [Phycisphaeraceae bacterium]
MSANTTKSMDEIVALCRRRGFIWQSSEIYGGINGFWDYGPLGAQLKKNLKDAWWADVVQADHTGPDGEPFQIVPVDCTIIMHPKVWEASGHVGGFADLRCMCKECKKFVRADHIWESIQESQWYQSLAENYPEEKHKNLVNSYEAMQQASQWIGKWAKTKGKKLAPNLPGVKDTGILENAKNSLVQNENTFHGLANAIRALSGGNLNPNDQWPCPNCGGQLTEPKPFNLMFQTHVGAVQSEDSASYLRPETAQGIFTQFWNVVDTSRVKVPFGIAQVGKAFRNEVTPRNFTFRSREFEQMEIEFFIHPGEAEAWYGHWRQARYDWWKSLGLEGENLILRDHDKEELA